MADATLLLLNLKPNIAGVTGQRADIVHYKLPNGVIRSELTRLRCTQSYAADSLGFKVEIIRYERWCLRN
jgi:hypothetical protein